MKAISRIMIKMKSDEVKNEEIKIHRYLRYLL